MLRETTAKLQAHRAWDKGRSERLARRLRGAMGGGAVSGWGWGANRTRSGGGGGGSGPGQDSESELGRTGTDPLVHDEERAAHHLMMMFACARQTRLVKPSWMLPLGTRRWAAGRGPLLQVGAEAGHGGSAFEPFAELVLARAARAEGAVHGGGAAAAGAVDLSARLLRMDVPWMWLPAREAARSLAWGGDGGVTSADHGVTSALCAELSLLRHLVQVSPQPVVVDHRLGQEVFGRLVQEPWMLPAFEVVLRAAREATGGKALVGRFSVLQSVLRELDREAGTASPGGVLGGGEGEGEGAVSGRDVGGGGGGRNAETGGVSPPAGAG